MNAEVVETRLAALIRDRMEELKLSIRDVAEQVGVTYEVMRRCCNGISVPSKLVRRELARVLVMDVQELDLVAASDNILKKWGGLPSILADKNPDLEPVERVWPNLTEDQRHMFLEQMQALARRNRTLKHSA